MKRYLLLTTVALLGLLAAVPGAAATTYYGPSFSVSSTSLGGTTYITLTTGSGTTLSAPPTGLGVQCPSDTTCIYPLQACTDPTQFYYSIHQITVNDKPDGSGNQYMLGSATTSGLVWPSLLGGPVSPTQTTNNGFADALNVTIGDSFSLPFGTGAGGFTFTSLLSNPPNTVSSAGPYYWWTTSNNNVPNVWGNNLRLDQHTSITPTTAAGPYVVDLEGVVVCGTGVFFDQGVKLFFDQPSQLTVPEFPFGLAALMAIAIPALLLLRSKHAPIATQ